MELSRREKFILAAMQGLLAGEHFTEWEHDVMIDGIAKYACEIADKTIAEMDATKKAKIVDDNRFDDCPI